MKGKYLWPVLLVIHQIASVFGRNSIEVVVNPDITGNDIHVEYYTIPPKRDNKIALSSIASFALLGGSIALFVILISCICYHCAIRTVKQTHFSGIIVNSDRNQDVNEVQFEQPVVTEHDPPRTPGNQLYNPHQSYPIQYTPVQQFPPQYQPMQQFPPHSHPMQQFPPQKQPMQQFSPQNQPMQQFSPQNQPMQQFSPQNHPMQQFSPQHSPLLQFSPQHSPLQSYSPQHSPGRKPQQSATASHIQFPPQSENFFNYPEPPPPYANDLPPKY